MFWNNSKPNKKESNSTAIVRQDPRTTVKTATAHSETTSRSVQNDTIFNSNNNTVAFRTTTQTITHQQQARITEINKRYTPTPEELAEMRSEIFSKNENSNMTNGRRKPAKLPAIDYKSYPFSGGALNKSPKSPLIFSFDDSPRAYSNKSTTPTIGKVQKTTVTQKEGRSVTLTTQEQRIKIGVSSSPNSYQFSSYKPTSRLPALTNNMTTKLDNMRLMPDAKPFVLSSPNSPLTTKQLPTSNGVSSTAFGGGSSVYQSPYLKRTITTTTTTTPSSTKTPITRPSVGASATNTTTNTKLNWLNVPTISVVPPSSNGGSNATTRTNLYSSTPSTPSLATKSATNNLVKSTASQPQFAASTVSSRKKSKLLPGYVYIFNNEVFDNPSNEYRVGSSVDVKNLRKTFETYKMKVHVIENATLDKIASTVKKIETKDFSNISCIVIVILSHGTRHEEVSAKDGTYSIDDKVLFPILRNRTLNDKPKIMLIQACKGAMEIGGFHTDAVQPHGSPNEILKCYSTFEGYVSYRTEKGSIFIQTACEFLQMFGSIKNIKDIMERVNMQVKQKTESRQIPAILSTLTKPYIFGDYV